MLRRNCDTDTSRRFTVLSPRCTQTSQPRPSTLGAAKRQQPCALVFGCHDSCYRASEKVFPYNTVTSNDSKKRNDNESNSYCSAFLQQVCNSELDSADNPKCRLRDPSGALKRTMILYTGLNLRLTFKAESGDNGPFLMPFYQFRECLSLRFWQSSMSPIYSHYYISSFEIIIARK
jgi:hypothetical protein